MRQHENVDSFSCADSGSQRYQCNLSDRVVSDSDYMNYRGRSSADSSCEINGDGSLSFGSAFDECNGRKSSNCGNESFVDFANQWNEIVLDLRSGDENEFLQDLHKFLDGLNKYFGQSDKLLPHEQPLSAQEYIKEHAAEIENAYHVRPGEDLNRAIQDHPGEMIVVDGGSYSGPINIDGDGTKLVGINGATIEGPPGGSTGSYNRAVNLNGRNQDFVGFNIDGNGGHTVGIVSWQQGNRNNVIGNNIYNSKETAIADWTDGAPGGSNIIGNTITDVGDPSTQLAHGIYYDASDGTIANNTIKQVKGGFGIQLWDGHNTPLTNITVENNSVDGATKSGLVIGDDPESGSAEANNITIRNNSFKNNGTYGIQFYGNYDTSSIRLINNHVSGNGDDNVSYQ